MARWSLAVALAVTAVLAIGAPAATGQEDEPVTGLRGTLRDAGEPVADVEIVVRDAAGDEVGVAVTADDGTWELELPGPGRYDATLVVDSLPEDVGLRDPDADTRSVTVQTGQVRTLLFPLGESTRGGTAFADRVAQAAVNGLKFGLIIAMTAVGLSLIFGTTGLINFAHSELVTFGAVAAWYLNATGPGIQLVGAALLAVAIAGAVGALLERGLWHPLRARRVGGFQLLVISIGLSLAARHVLLIFFGGRSKPYSDYTIQSELDLGPVGITPRDLVVMVLSTVLLIGVATMLQRTRMGKAMRAVSDNVDLAESSGIDVQRVILVVWIAGAMLAATGGIFLGVVENVNWLMGFRLLLLMFAGVILGGLGTAYGAMVGSLVIGFVTEMSILWTSPELKFVWALLALVLVLLVRPQGILGFRERIG